jgi:hypothetical protein
MPGMTGAGERMPCLAAFQRTIFLLSSVIGPPLFIASHLHPLYTRQRATAISSEFTSAPKSSPYGSRIAFGSQGSAHCSSNLTSSLPSAARMMRKLSGLCPCTRHVDLEHPVPVLRVSFWDGAVESEPSVGDEDVYGVESLDRPGDERAAGGGVRDVGTASASLPPRVPRRGP